VTRIATLPGFANFLTERRETRGSPIYVAAQRYPVAAAACWQGYTALVGFVPERKISHAMLARPTKKKLFFR
jgi:hypothetical protein